MEHLEYLNWLSKVEFQVKKYTMNKLFLAAGGFCLVIIAASCNPFNGRRDVLSRIFASHNEQRIVVNDNNNSLEIIYSGDMEFNDEETAIKQMSPGGYLEYRRNGEKLLAETDSRGEIIYSFSSNGRPLTADYNGKTFLTRAIQDMIAYGINAKGRLDRLYEEGGIPLVLLAAKKLKADHVKKIYFEYMLNRDGISTDEMMDITKGIGTKIGSDYEKRQLLEKVPANYLKDSLTAQAFFASVKSINSDYDKANTLKKMLKQNLPEEAFVQLLQVAGTVNSDNDKANLLKELINNGSYPKEDFRLLLAAINTLNSDYEKTNVLKILVGKETYSGEDYSDLMSVVSKINSDNDKSNLIKDLIQKGTNPEENYDKLLEVIGTLNSENDRLNMLKILIEKGIFSGEHFSKLLGVISKISNDYEKVTLYKKLIEQPITTEEQWVGIINETASISSDNDKANLLLQISKKMPQSETIKLAYKKASKTINSDHDYTRTIKGIE